MRKMRLRKRYSRFSHLKVSHGVAPVLRFHGAGTGRARGGHGARFHSNGPNARAAAG
jgi:hypothetical protein